MNVTEANAFAPLLRYALKNRQGEPVTAEEEQRALEGAAVLADHYTRRMQCGETGDEVRAA